MAFLNGRVSPEQLCPTTSEGRKTELSDWHGLVEKDKDQSNNNKGTETAIIDGHVANECQEGLDGIPEEQLHNDSSLFHNGKSTPGSQPPKRNSRSNPEGNISPGRYHACDRVVLLAACFISAASLLLTLLMLFGVVGPLNCACSGETGKFNCTTDHCTLRTAGSVCYNASQNVLQLSDGSAWLPILTAGKGHVENNPGRHCLDILNSGHSRGNGLYWIDPNGGSPDDSFQAFCDMETERGGWTLVFAKIRPGSEPFKPEFSIRAARTKNEDGRSHIHPDMGDWEEVMFRFAGVTTIRVIYNRKAGAPRNDTKEFDNFLMGISGSKEYNQKNITGFYKYSPADHNQRTPAVGFATIYELQFYYQKGISESFAGTDKWLNMLGGGDSSNNYVTCDYDKAKGAKCIAGYCYLNKAIWMMVR